VSDGWRGQAPELRAPDPGSAPVRRRVGVGDHRVLDEQNRASDLRQDGVRVEGIAGIH
jgi:hypothetical protein